MNLVLFYQTSKTTRVHKQISDDVNVGCNDKGSIQKKNAYKAVRLTAWVDPPSPSPEAVRKM